ncbi:MAG: tetratricopeptide repeat protein [Acidobacteria bacterium]|nr:MAG: tetratricopeptide repeat protein [Acidobacteriota bacterium]
MRRLVIVGFCCLVTLGAQKPSQASKTPVQLIEELSQSGTEALEKRELEKAESDFRRLLAISLDQLGAVYDRLGDYQKAERAFREASRSSSDATFRALLGLGIVYLKMGRYDDGIAAVEQILPLDLLNTDARHLLGKLYFMKGDFELAARELNRALKQEPDNVRVAYTLGLALLRLRRLDDANRVFADMQKKLGDTPEFHLLIGRGMRETGYPNEAVAEFKRALAMNPKTPRAHYYLGLTYLKREGGAAFPEARREFQAELAHSPDDFLPNFFLGVVAVRSRDYQTAIQYLRRAVELDPISPDPYAYLGQALFQSGDEAGAMPLLKKAIELTADESHNGYQIANTHFMLGQALRKAGRIEEAAEYLKRSQVLKTMRARQQANPQALGPPEAGARSSEDSESISEPEADAVILDLNPPDAKSRKGLEGMIALHRKNAAFAYQSLGRVETMRADFRRAADFLENAAFWDPSLREVFFNLGLARLKAEQPEKAAAALLTAWQHSPAKPEIPQLLAPLALQLVELRQLDEAWNVSEVLVKARPEVADLYVLRGRILAFKGKWDDALAQLRLALQKNPSIGEAHYIAGTVLIRQGELDRALEEFDSELRLSPRHPQAIYHRAFVLVSQRKPDEAIPLLEEVTRLAPGYAEPYYQLGKALLDKNESLLAIANLETAAKLNPDAYYIQYQLSRAYTKSQRREDARQALAKYQELKKAHDQRRNATRSEAPALEEVDE